MMSGYHSDEEGEAVQEEVSNRVGVSNSDPSNDTKQKSVGKSLTSMDTQMEDFLKVLYYTVVLFVLIAIYTVESHYSEAKRRTSMLLNIIPYRRKYWWEEYFRHI